MIVVVMTMIWTHYWKSDLEAIGLGYTWIQDVKNDVGDSSVVGRGLAGRLDHDQQCCYQHAPTVKPEAATAVVELLMMGVRTAGRPDHDSIDTI